jgi:hypothetical protein
MAAIKVSEGSVVKIRGTGRTGRVISLTAQKTPGKRGRPPTMALVLHDDISEGTQAYGVRELELV